MGKTIGISDLVLDDSKVYIILTTSRHCDYIPGSLYFLPNCLISREIQIFLFICTTDWVDAGLAGAPSITFLLSNVVSSLSQYYHQDLEKLTKRKQ